MTMQFDPSVNERIAVDFFQAFSDHDVDKMVAMCSEDADFSSIPFEMWGRQRVLRGDGKVCTIGKPIWKSFIASFPDLKHDVVSVVVSPDGDMAVEVTVSGTQVKDWGPIAAKNMTFSEPNLFLLRVNSSGQISEFVSYWDNASMYRQLGHLEVD